MVENSIIEETYRIGKHNVQVKGHLFQDHKGCYKFDMSYREPKFKREGGKNMYTDVGLGERVQNYSEEGGSWSKTKLVLNGPGKSKLEKKILSFLRSKFQ
ncbi:hypothetical protein CL617_01465 [archaeon]|nr:hypothetical protein [archaeon]|tara:strand:+ start:9197 stop:9496 length:300 start_codon:yes stop_codon:yes gene_type:complete